MMEVLFRGKRVDNGEWVHGWYVFRGEEAGFKEQKHYILAHDECGFLWHEVVPETVGQYTGLKDKNCTKIFDGDIVQANDVKVLISGEEKYNVKATFCVIWRYEGFMFEICSCENKELVGLAFPSFDLHPYWKIEDELEVIGNIYDNQELLENYQNFS